METLQVDEEREELEEHELPRGEGDDDGDNGDGGDGDGEEDDNEEKGGEAWERELIEIRHQIAELRTTTEAKSSEYQAKLDQLQQTAREIQAKLDEEVQGDPSAPQPSIPPASPEDPTPRPQEPEPKPESPKPNEAESEENAPAKPAQIPNGIDPPPAKRFVKVQHKRRSI